MALRRNAEVAAAARVIHEALPLICPNQVTVDKAPNSVRFSSGASGEDRVVVVWAEELSKMYPTLLIVYPFLYVLISRNMAASATNHGAG